MKYLFLLFAFINIVFYFWANNLVPQGEKISHEVPFYEQSSIEILQMISSRELALASATKQSNKPTARIESNLCLDIGNHNKKEALALSNKLVGLSQHLLIVTNNRFVDEEYWVVSPSANTWEASVKNMAFIKSKNISDIWLVPNGEDRGVVSLGLYSELTAANKRIENLVGKQIKAEIITIKKERYSIRLENIISPNGIFDQLNKLFEGEEIEIHKINC